MKTHLPLDLRKFQARVDQRLDRWAAQNFSRKLWAKDITLWHPDSMPEITDRLGWLDLPERMGDKCDEILSYAHQIIEEGFSHVLLLGMGGSSLAPEVFQRTFGNSPGFPELCVLDSTHPAAVLAVEKKLDLAHTLFLISSKSGTTLETLSLFRYFWDRAMAIHDKPGHRFAAITDAGSPLEQLAREHNFRRIFLPFPDVGGRYSAFSEFGLVPAALIGLDIQKLLDKGRIASRKSRLPGAEENSFGFVLGAALGELAHHRDKLTIWTTSSLDGFPAWLEQLIAESTGKQGRGIVPVVGEPFVPSDIYGEDRVFVGLYLEETQGLELENRLIGLKAAGHPTIRIGLKEKLDLGTEIFLWELAAASAGAVLGIHPFNQPDVQLAKDYTRKAMEMGKKARKQARDTIETFSTEEEKACASALQSLLSTANPGDYIALQAFLPPSREVTQALQKVRSVLLQQTRLATTLGFGPRFLHSTGQLHKGGPNTVLALQIIDKIEQDLIVPETGYSFATLIEAQALGDYQALKQRERRVLRIAIEPDTVEGLKKLENLLSSFM
jgi:transaldolase/glucose-6-phosphate isomerase